jgi:uncharacterized membrane protein YkvI
MEENVLTAPADYKLYNERSIVLGSFLGGPLVSAYLIAENFRNLGQRNKIRMTWIIGVVVMVALLVISFTISNYIKIPNAVIPAIYILIAQRIAKHYQGNDIKTHLEGGGQVYSQWRTALIGLIGLVILLAIIFAVAYFIMRIDS